MNKFTRLAVALCAVAVPAMAFADTDAKADAVGARSAAAISAARTVAVTPQAPATATNPAPLVLPSAPETGIGVLAPEQEATVFSVEEATLPVYSVFKKDAKPRRKIANISDIYGNWVIKGTSPYWDTDYYTVIQLSANDSVGRVTVTFPQLSATVQSYMSAYALVDLDEGTISFPCFSTSENNVMGVNGTTEYYYYALRHTSGTSYNCLYGLTITFQLNDDGTLSSTTLPYTSGNYVYTGLGLCARNSSTGSLTGISITTNGVTGMVPANGTLTYTYSSKEYNIPVLGRYYTEEGVDYMEVGPVIYNYKGSPVRMVLNQEERTGKFTSDDFADITYSTANSKRDDYLLVYQLCNAASSPDVQGSYSEDLKTVSWKGANCTSSENWCALDTAASRWYGSWTPATLVFSTVDDAELVKAGMVESLNIIGTFELDGQQVSWDPSKVVPMNRDGQVFTAEVSLTGDPAYFSFCENVGTDSIDWAGIAPRYGAETNNYALTAGVAAPVVKENPDSAFTLPAGNYFITVDMEAKTVVAAVITDNPFEGSDMLADYLAFNADSLKCLDRIGQNGVTVDFDGVTNTIGLKNLFIPNSNYTVSGTYDPATGAVTIPAAQTVYYHSTYGAYRLYKGDPSDYSETDALTGTLNADGTLTIDGSWIILFSYSGITYYYDCGASTVLRPHNAVISYHDDYYGADGSYGIVVEETTGGVNVLGLGNSNYYAIFIAIDGDSASMASQYTGYSPSAYGDLYTYPYTVLSTGGISISKADSVSTVYGTYTNDWGLKTIALDDWAFAYKTTNYLTTPLFGQSTIVWGERVAPNYVAVGKTADYAAWNYPNALPDSVYGKTKPSVESYDDYIIFRAYAGVEGYDLKVYREGNTITGIAPIYSGEEGTVTTKGYATLYTGLTGDTDYYMQPYVSSSYMFLYDNGKDTGYMGIMSYMNGVASLYYIAWPYVPEPVFTVTGEVGDYDNWTYPNVLPDSTYGTIRPTVESYEEEDNYLIIRAFAGVEGYDMKVTYDSSRAITAIAGIRSGVEDATATSGNANVYTGLTGDSDYCFQPFVDAGYGYVYNLGENSGYVAVLGYMGSTYGTYYISWPYVAPDTLYVAGLSGNWDPSAPEVVEGTGKVFTFTLPKGTTEFKISTAKSSASGDWEGFNAGAYCVKDGELIADNTGATKYALVSGTSNIKLAYGDGQWTITVDLAEGVISGVNATDAPSEVPETLYVIGELVAGSWDCAAVAPLTKDGNTFTGTVDFSGNSFSLCEKQGTTGDWSSIGRRWGAETDQYVLNPGSSAKIYLGNNDNAFKINYTLPEGETAFTAELKVDFDEGTVTLKDNITGVETLLFDANGEVEYYNLQGIRVVNPSRGFYILRQGTSARTVYLK